MWARILDCELGPGDRLPSQRRIARTCRVHRRTVREAYCRLERGGLIALGPRARARVVNPGARSTSAEAGDSRRAARREVASWLLLLPAQAAAAGFSASDLARTLTVWEEAIRARRLTIFSDDFELTRLLEADIRARFRDDPVIFARTSEAALPLMPVLPGRSADADSPAELSSLSGIPPVPIHLFSNSEARYALKALHAGQVAAVVTRSRVAASLIRHTASVWCHAEVGFLACDAADETTTVRALSVANLVIGQVPDGLLRAAGFRGDVVPLRLVSRLARRTIRARLGMWNEPCSG